MPIPTSRDVEAIQALRTRLDTLGADLWNVLYEDDDSYVPVPGTPYIAESWIGGPSEQAEVGIGSTKQHNFSRQWQLLLHSPEDVSGAAFAWKNMAAAIHKAFTNTRLTLTDGVTAIRIMDVRTGTKREGSPWNTIPVVISYEFTATHA